VVNMYDKKYKVRPEEIELSVNVPILAVVPYDEEIIRSNVFKIPISILNPNAKSSKEFEKLARRIAGLKERGGILERIRKFFRH